MKKRRTASQKPAKRAPKKKASALSKPASRKAKSSARKVPSAKPRISSRTTGRLGTITVHKRIPVKKTANLRDNLPFSYGKTKLALLVRDPEWGYAYWDFSAETWLWVEDFYRREHGAKAKLRIHNMDRNTFYDLDIDLQAKNWYVQFGLANTTFEAELGFMDAKGKFHSIARSNRVKTPRNRPSEKIDPAWNPADVGWDDIYRLSGGELFGQSSAGSISSPVKKRA